MNLCHNILLGEAVQPGIEVGRRNVFEGEVRLPIAPLEPPNFAHAKRAFTVIQEFGAPIGDNSRTSDWVTVMPFAVRARINNRSSCVPSPLETKVAVKL